MSETEYSVIVEQPLYDVLTRLGDLSTAGDWVPHSPSGGLRFEVVAGGTRVTVLGEGASSAPGLLASLIQSFPRDRLLGRRSRS